MLFSIDKTSDDITPVPEEGHASLDILERDDLEEWIIREPALLEENLLIISSEYAMFEDTRDRLDILALDPEGKLVVAELKRDRADRTTDLQAIKYASYCSTLTAQQIQKDYRTFWNDRGDEYNYSPENVGRKFKKHLNQNREEDVVTTEEGWADFELDDEPRIIIAAGNYGTEVTSPVMWLVEQYGLDISCVQIKAYEHEEKIVLSSQQLVPPPEAEEYMTRRREKKKEQSETQTDTEKLYLQFWRRYCDFVQENSDIRCSKPKPKSKISHRFNMAGTYIASIFSKYNSLKQSFEIGELRVDFVLSSGNAQGDEIYRELQSNREEIESKIEPKLEWINPEDTQRKRIVARREADVEDRENWDEYQNWLLEHVEQFHDVFVPILKSEF